MFYALDTIGNALCRNNCDFAFLMIYRKLFKLKGKFLIA